MTTTYAPAPASPKAAKYARDLFASRVHSFPALPTDREITALEARFLIDNLRTAPWAPRPVAPAVAALRVGFYRSVTGSVLKIVQNKTNDRLSGRYLTEDGRWEYDRSVLAEAAAGHRITVEEAAQYGRETHRCLICATPLDADGKGEAASKAVKLSVARGIGPVCFKRLQAN